MVIYLTGEVKEQPRLDELTPRQIVTELDKYVVGQHAAKRAVAIALRNRIRRQKLPQELSQDIIPKNIIMIGPTGVGKTEIARRLARLSNSPFLKVEASKFTEVGYVGRDVESMIRDLVEIAIDLVREEKIGEIAEKAEQNAEERMLDMLLPRSRQLDEGPDGDSSLEQFERTREKLRQQLRDNKLNNRIVELEVQERGFPGHFEIYTPQGIEEMDINLRDMFPNMFSSRPKQRKMRVDEAMEYLIQEEEQKLIDMDQVARAAIERVEDYGIIFLDEIDKIAGREAGSGPDVSREGVQRDILPIVEGTTVNTRYGMVRTDITFTEAAIDSIARFAFSVNEQTEDIGARRLHTIMETLLDEVSFEGPDLEEKTVVVDEAYVNRMLAHIVKNEDLSRYIL
jgi:ATP-dependent HslUV protease ATP-binding subunit HslU